MSSLEEKRAQRKDEWESRIKKLAQKNQSTRTQSRVKLAILETLRAHHKMTMQEIHDSLPTYSRGYLYRLMKELMDQEIVVKYKGTYRMRYVYRDGEWVEVPPEFKEPPKKKELWSHPTAMNDGNWLSQNFPEIALLTAVRNKEVRTIVEEWARQRPQFVKSLWYGLLITSFIQKNQRPLDLLPIDLPPVGPEEALEILEKIETELS